MDAVGRLRGGRRPAVPPRAGRAGRRVISAPGRVVHALRHLAVSVWRLGVHIRVVHIRRDIGPRHQGVTNGRRQQRWWGEVVKVQSLYFSNFLNEADRGHGSADLSFSPVVDTEDSAGDKGKSEETEGNS